MANMKKMSKKEMVEIYKDAGMKVPAHLKKLAEGEAKQTTLTQEDELNEPDDEPTPKRKVVRAARNGVKIDFNQRMKDKLEEQNEILMLQFQQRSLIQAIQTGNLPDHLENKPAQTEEKTSLSETIDLITKVKKLFPSEEQFEPEPEESMEDFAIKQVIGALANKAMGGGISPAPVEQPAPVDVPWEATEEELIRPTEVKENVDTKASKRVVKPLLKNASGNVRKPKKQPKNSRKNTGATDGNKQQALNPAK